MFVLQKLGLHIFAANVTKIILSHLQKLNFDFITCGSWMNFFVTSLEIYLLADKLRRIFQILWEGPKHKFFCNFLFKHFCHWLDIPDDFESLMYLETVTFQHKSVVSLIFSSSMRTVPLIFDFTDNSEIRTEIVLWFSVACRA